MLIKKNKTKGQVEFVAVAALVALVLVAVFITMQNSLFPGNLGNSMLSDEQRLIKESITNLIRLGAEEELTKLYEQGGYIDTQATANIEYGGIKIPLWSACGEVSFPEITKELERGIADYIVRNVETRTEFYGKDVVFDLPKLKVEANILDEKIDIKVNLPVTVESFEMPPLYTVSVNTKIKEIMEFSKSFTNEANKTKVFELITIASMAQSNEDNDAWTPINGMLTGCGKKITRRREQLLEGTKRMISYTLSHTAWDRKTPRLADNAFFSFNRVGGKYYDLNVSFVYPEDWNNKIDEKFATVPETLRVSAKPIFPLVPVCLAPYTVSYSFQYPVVVSVKDEIMNQHFRFALMSNIENNLPSDNCSAELFSGRTDYEKKCIDNAKCDFNIQVIDKKTGRPVEGADVSFAGCDLGVTDATGILKSDKVKAPCMIGEFVVRKEGYNTYGDFLTPDEISAYNVNAIPSREILVRYFGIRMWAAGGDDEGRYNFYGTSDTTPVKINETRSFETPSVLMNLSVQLRFVPLKPNIFTGEEVELLVTNEDYDENGNKILLNEKPESMIKPIRYNVLGTVEDEDKNTQIGYINETIEIGEDQTSLCVYAPVVAGIVSTGNRLEKSVNTDESKKIIGTIVPGSIPYLIGECTDVTLSSCRNNDCDPGETCEFDEAIGEYDCDAGTPLPPDSECRNDCTYCGDEIKDTGYEECDFNEPNGPDRSFGLGESEDNQYSCSTDCKQDGGWCGDNNKNGPEECDYGGENDCCTEDCKWKCPDDYKTETLLFEGGMPSIELESGQTTSITNFPACRIIDESGSVIQARAEMLMDTEKIAVVFVTDVSGSMGSSVSGGSCGGSGEPKCKISLAKDALIQSINKLSDTVIGYGADISVGLVSFSKDIEETPMTQVGSEENDNFLKSEINSYVPKAETYTKNAVSKAYDKLKESGAGKRKIMILLSDGLPTPGYDPQENATEAKNHGIEIYTIAFAGGDELKVMCDWSSDGGSNCNSDGYSYEGESVSEMLDKIIEDIIQKPEGKMTIEISGEGSNIQIADDIMEISNLDLSGISCDTKEQNNIPLKITFNGGGRIRLSNMKLNYCPYCPHD